MAPRKKQKGYYGYFSLDKETEELSYRLPMRVTEVRFFRNGSTYSVCPRCNRSLEREYMKFCDCCGQRLEWRGFSKAKVVHVPTR